MQYVLVNNGYVINGPRGWNHRSFESTLDEDLEISLRLPFQKDDAEPILVNDTTKILPATLVYPEYNAKIEYLDGPYWTYDDDFATGTFEVKDQPIEYVKQTLIGGVAANRYIKENLGTTTEIQGSVITVDTSRDGRAIFVQAYTLMAEDGTINWKFPEGWFVLSKPELGQVVGAGATYVQSCFDWEQSKTVEINNCTTLEELNNIDIGDPVPPEASAI